MAVSAEAAVAAMAAAVLPAASFPDYLPHPSGATAPEGLSRKQPWERILMAPLATDAIGTGCFLLSESPDRALANVSPESDCSTRRITLPPGLAFRDLGPRALKGKEREVELTTVVDSKEVTSGLR